MKTDRMTKPQSDKAAISGVKYGFAGLFCGVVLGYLTGGIAGLFVGGFAGTAFGVILGVDRSLPVKGKQA